MTKESQTTQVTPQAALAHVSRKSKKKLDSDLLRIRAEEIACHTLCDALFSSERNHSKHVTRNSMGNENMVNLQ